MNTRILLILLGFIYSVSSLAAFAQNDQSKDPYSMGKAYMAANKFHGALKFFDIWRI